MVEPNYEILNTTIVNWPTLSASFWMSSYTDHKINYEEDTFLETTTTKPYGTTTASYTTIHVVTDDYAKDVTVEKVITTSATCAFETLSITKRYPLRGYTYGRIEYQTERYYTGSANVVSYITSDNELETYSTLRSTYDDSRLRTLSSNGISVTGANFTYYRDSITNVTSSVSGTSFSTSNMYNKIGRYSMGACSSGTFETVSSETKSTVSSFNKYEAVQKDYSRSSYSTEYHTVYHVESEPFANTVTVSSYIANTVYYSEVTMTNTGFISFNPELGLIDSDFSLSTSSSGTSYSRGPDTVSTYTDTVIVYTDSYSDADYASNSSTSLEATGSQILTTQNNSAQILLTSVFATVTQSTSSVSDYYYSSWIYNDSTLTTSSSSMTSLAYSDSYSTASSSFSYTTVTTPIEVATTGIYVSKPYLEDQFKNYNEYKNPRIQQSVSTIVEDMFEGLEFNNHKVQYDTDPIELDYVSTYSVTIEE